MNDERIRANLAAVRDRIAEAARRAGRDPAAVTLVAVTKKNPIERIEPLIAAGQRDLGENFPQELWRKAEALADRPVRWHLIGHLQTNKAKRTCRLVRLIHAVDSLKLLQDARRASRPTRRRVCLQVELLGRGVQARLVARRPAGRRRGDRRLPAAGRRPDDDGRLRDDRRGGPPGLRPAPRRSPRSSGSGPASRSPSSRWGCPATSRRPSRRARRWSGSARRCSRGSTNHDRPQRTPRRHRRPGRAPSPGRSKTAVLGERAGALRLAVTAPPDRGKANDAIADLLAATLGCKSSAVRLLTGATSRQKRFLIVGLDAGRGPRAARRDLATGPLRRLNAVGYAEGSNTSPNPSHPMPDYPPELTITPLPRPPKARVRVPGSKSLTNRALDRRRPRPGDEHPDRRPRQRRHPGHGRRPPEARPGGRTRPGRRDGPGPRQGRGRSPPSRPTCSSATRGRPSGS